MKSIAKIAEYVVAIGAIAGGAIWFDNISDGQKEIQESQEEFLVRYKEDQVYAGAERSLIMEDVEVIKDSLEDIKEAQAKDHQSMLDLATLVRNRGNFSEAQMKILFDEWLKKNYSLNEKIMIPLMFEDSMNLTMR